MSVISECLVCLGSVEEQHHVIIVQKVFKRKMSLDGGKQTIGLHYASQCREGVRGDAVPRTREQAQSEGREQY